MLLSLISLKAQNSFYYPYGMGKSYINSSTRMEAMGYSGSAIYDSLQVTSYNPGMWHSFNTVSLQGKLDYSSMSSSKINGNYKTTSLEGFTIKMPIGNYSGLAFGLKSLFRVNSKSIITDHVSFFDESLDFENSIIMNGGVSDFFLGAGYRVTEYLSAGLVANFLFGKYSTRIKTEGESSLYYYNKINNIKGRQLGFGLNWDVPDNYAISLYYDRNLDFKYDQIVDYHIGKDDTLDYKSIDYPSNLQIGVKKHIKPGLIATADINYSSLPNSLSQLTVLGSGKYNDAYLIGAGLEKQPSQEFNPGLLQRMYYRLGGFYRKEGFRPLEENGYGQSYTEKGVSLGLGLPFYNDYSRLDISLIYSIADGFLDSEIGKENKITINFEITSGGLWFNNALRK
ncbi:MAG: hypothetical protein K9M80_04140 [Candidatus Marinimicrobia bacterium]|nr:hypothetical protein [Candidatus Neomarinimicrobiota bacterium]